MGHAAEPAAVQVIGPGAGVGGDGAPLLFRPGEQLLVLQPALAQARLAGLLLQPGRLGAGLIQAAPGFLAGSRHGAGQLGFRQADLVQG